MRSGPNFIPKIGGKKGETLLKDQGRFDIDKEVVPEFWNGRKNSRAKHTQSENMQLIFKEVASNILSDVMLKFSIGNPSYYPPVPKTRTETPGYSHPRKTMYRENFGNTQVYISNRPITIDEWEKYNVSGFPYISPQHFYQRLEKMRTISGMHVRENYSYPNVIDRVKWCAYFFCSAEGNELLGVYCYENMKALEEILGFLSDIPVRNEHEKNEAIRNLLGKYWLLAQKSS